MRFAIRSLFALAVAGLFATARAASASSPAKRDIELVYAFTIEGIPASARQVRAWIPMPAVTKHQAVTGYQILSGQSARILTDPEYGNHFLFFDLDPTTQTLGETVTIRVAFHVRRQAYRALDEQPGKAVLEKPSKFLRPSRLIPINGKIAAEARRVAGGIENPRVRARRLYDHVVKSVSYDKSGRGWGKGDALYVCDARRGNCTDFHSLFIGEARALGLPARFIMGIPLPSNRAQGDIPGYHCWAEFFLKGKGWIPIDASEASKHPEKTDQLFGGLDANRVQFTLGRDIRLPLAQCAPLNYAIYPHVEIDGTAYPDVLTHFSFRDIAPQKPSFKGLSQSEREPTSPAHRPAS